MQLPHIINFSEESVKPDLRWHKSRGYLRWGKKNDYPEMLLDYYNVNGASSHKAIINKKIKLIAGNGFKTLGTQPETEFQVKQWIRKTHLKHVLGKCTTDYEIFNGFAVEVVWSNDGTTITDIQHVPFHKLRIGYNEEDPNTPEFVWFSHDWQLQNKPENEPEAIPLYNLNNRVGKQIYYYVEYNPASEFYPSPGYHTGLNWIDLGWRISNFHLNQIRNGYAPSYVLNFSGSIPTPEEQEEFAKAFKRKYKSDENAGKIIITWSDMGENAPTLIPINGNDSDTRFSMLSEQLREEIAVAHETPIPLVSAIPGKLGGSAERLELMQEFQFSYIDQRQEVIEDVMNQILVYAPVSFGIQLKKRELEPIEFSKITKTAIDSSNVARAQWDAITNDCVVEFVDGGTYTYFDVAREDFFRWIGKDARCVTDDTSPDRKWWIGKPSVGAGVSQILERYEYEPGGAII